MQYRPQHSWDWLSFLGLIPLGWVLSGVEGVPYGDAPLLGANAARLVDLLKSYQFSAFIYAFFDMAIPQPPLGYLPLIAGQLLQGSNGRILAALLALALCGDGLRRLGGVGWGWAFLALLSSAMIWQYSWEYGWDLAATAVIVQALAALQQAQNTPSPRAWAIASLWLIVGVLTKYTVPFFMIIPWGWALVQASRSPQRFVLAKGLLAGILLSSVVALPWIYLHIGALQPYITGSLTEGAAVKITQNARSWSERLSWEGWLYYPLSLKDALGWPLLLLLIAGFRHPLARLSLISGLVLLSPLPAAVDRYALPALALLCLGATRLTQWPSGRLLGGVALGITALGSFANFRGPVSNIPQNYLHQSVFSLAWPRSPSYGPHQVDRVGWHLPELIQATQKPFALLLPFDGRVPDTGVFLQEARQQGWTQAIGVIRPLPPAAPEGQVEGGILSILVILDATQDLSASEAWLSAQGFRPKLQLRRNSNPQENWRLEVWQRE